MQATVRNLQLRPMIEALQLIASIDDPNRQAKPEKPPKAWKFLDAGKVRYNLARSYKSLTAANEAIEIARASLYKQHAAAQTEEAAEPGSPDQLRGKFLTAFTDDMNALLQQQIEVDLRPVEIDLLDLESNDIPFTAIAPLLDTVLVDKP